MQQRSSLFDHLVGAPKQRQRERKTKRLRSLEVEHQLDLDRLYHWQVGRLRSLEDTPSVDANLTIVFNTGGDPVEAGLVASFGRPGGNLTGVASVATTLMPKQFGLLSELAPKRS